METPSSTRRVTRSQTLAAANSNNNNIPMSKKFEESEKNATKSRQRGRKKKQQQDRSALIDITNDSPIVGLAKGGLETPSSAMSKRKVNGKAKYDGTPGSGEALLRGQVKTLLQKVEEEAELFSRVNSLEEIRPFQFHLQGVVHSPMGLLLAPTPANTPQVLNLSSPDGLVSVSPSPVDDKLVISQMVIDHTFQGEKQEGLQRSLLFEFSEKSESEESEDQKISDASSTRNDEEDDGGVGDELCEEFNKMSMNGDGAELLVEAAISPGALRLKGLPTPKGKHIRFREDSDEE